MKAVGVFASAGVLLLAYAGASGGALAERNGSFWYQGSSPPDSFNSQPSGGFFDLFIHRKQRSFNPNPFGRFGHSARRPVEVESAPPIEKILVYQPEKLVPLSATAFTEPAPSEPLAAAIYTELLDPDSQIRLTAAEKAAVLAFYRGNGFKPLWTTTTGHFAAFTQCRLTEPRCVARNPSCPRLPTTSTSAAPDSSISTSTGCP